MSPSLFDQSLWIDIKAVSISLFSFGKYKQRCRKCHRKCTCVHSALLEMDRWSRITEPLGTDVLKSQKLPSVRSGSAGFSTSSEGLNSLVKAFPFLASPPPLFPSIIITYRGDMAAEECAKWEDGAEMESGRNSLRGGGSMTLGSSVACS